MLLKKSVCSAVALFLALALCFALVGCKGKDKDKTGELNSSAETPVDATNVPEITPEPATPTPAPTPTPTPEPVKAEIQKDGAAVSSVEAMAGTVFQLTATVSDGSTGGIWSSNDESILSVDANGVVSCWKKGSATISYTLGEVSAQCAVTVSEPVLKIIFGGAVKSDITLNGLWGYSIQLAASVTPADVQYTWAVDDETIAKVDETGLVTALKAGTTTVRLKSGTTSTSCVLRIIGNPPGAVQEDKAPATPDPNDTTPRLVITFWGSPNSDFTVNVGASVDMDYVLYNVEGSPEVIWSIADPEFAAVDVNGVVTGIKSTKDGRPEKPYTILTATCGELKCETVVRVS